MYAPDTYPNNGVLELTSDDGYRSSEAEKEKIKLIIQKLKPSVIRKRSKIGYIKVPHTVGIG